MGTQFFRRNAYLFFTLLITSFGFVGCGEAEEGTVETREPSVMGVADGSLIVGQQFTVYGNNFLSPAMGEGLTKLVFEGTYFWEDENGNTVPEKVDSFTLSPLYDGSFAEEGLVNGVAMEVGTELLRWNRFGPFKVPFTHDGNKMGRFEGTIKALNYYADGEIIADPNPNPVTVDVEPSVIITMLEPVIGTTKEGLIRTPGCESPALRALAGLPYVIEVEAVGFEPVSFWYDLSNVNGKGEWDSYHHDVDPEAEGRDRLGDPAWHAGEMIVFNEIPEDSEYSLAAIRIVGVDAEGNSYTTALPLSIVRPLHFYYDGNYELAEYYEPQVVHGPVIGSIGTTVNYQESKSEQRQHAVSVSVSKSWTESQSQVQTSGWSEGVSTTNSSSTTNAMGFSHSESATSQETFGTVYSSSDSTKVDVSSQNGSSWGWNATKGVTNQEFSQQMNSLYGEVSGSVGTSVNGEGSIPGFAKVGGSVSTEVGAKTGTRAGNTQGQRVGRSNTEGSSMTESSQEGLVYGSTSTDGVSESIAGSYGLASQSTINQQSSETTGSSDSVTFNMNESVGITEGVTEGSQESWSETWSTSQTSSELFSYSSKVPKGRCAVVYRQTMRYVRRAQFYSYDLCGVRSLVGEADFNEWNWAPNIVIADPEQCDNGNVPDSSQPKAYCYKACD